MYRSLLLLSRTCAKEILPSTPQTRLRHPSLLRDTSVLTLPTLLPVVSISSHHALSVQLSLNFSDFYITVSQPATPSLLSIASSATSHSFDTPQIAGVDRSTTPNSVYSESPARSLPPASESEFQAPTSPQDDYLRRLPFVNTALKSYDYAKNNSRVVKFGAEMVESSVKTISKPVIDRLPGAVTNRVSCCFLFSFSAVLSTCLLPIIRHAFDRICTPSVLGLFFPAWKSIWDPVDPPILAVCHSFYPSLRQRRSVR
jgi:hypothetical protein